MLLLSGCSDDAADPTVGTSGSTHSPTDRSQTTTGAESTTPLPTTRQLGESVTLSNGNSVTAHEYRVVSDTSDHTSGAIDIEVCTGEENISPTSFETTEPWSVISVISVGDEYHRVADVPWKYDEISPVLEPEAHIPGGECLRGWAITYAGPDDEVTTIRYRDESPRDPNHEEILWEVPRDQATE